MKGYAVCGPSEYGKSAKEIILRPWLESKHTHTGFRVKRIGLFARVWFSLTLMDSKRSGGGEGWKSRKQISVDFWFVEKGKINYEDGNMLKGENRKCIHCIGILALCCVEKCILLPTTNFYKQKKLGRLFLQLAVAPQRSWYMSIIQYFSVTSFPCLLLRQRRTKFYMPLSFST